MAHYGDFGEFLRIFLRTIGCRRYLELGLQRGFTFAQVCTAVPYCVGVEIKLHPEFKKPKPEAIVHEMSTDEFFAVNQDRFEAIFIDADHRFEQVKIDFNNSLEALTPNGFIMLHDTDPINQKTLNACQDAYKMVEYVRGLGDYDIVTVPTSDSGLSIVSRKNNRRVLQFIGE